MASYFRTEISSTTRFGLADKIIEVLDTNLLANGWTRYAALATSSYANWDVVYQSTGASNDARIYIRINRLDSADPKIVFRAYSYWTIPGGFGYNEVGSTSVTVWEMSSAIMTWGQIFGLVDEYEATLFVENDDGDYMYFSFGQANRTDVVGSHGDFFAIGTQERSAGPHINILIDRSIADHYRFQEYSSDYDMVVQIISQEDGVNAADNMTTYFDNGSLFQITFEPLSIDVKVGYLYGLNAMPVYVSAATGASALTGYFLFDGTHSRTGPLDQAAALKPFVRDDVSAFDASAFNQLIYGSRLAFYSGDGESFLGVLRHLSALTAVGNVMGPGDRFMAGSNDPSDAYMLPFGQLLKWTSGELDWVPILGPGATRT